MPEPNTNSEVGRNSSVTSLSLLSRLKARDQDAWRGFVEIYCPAIYTHCRKKGVDADSTQDICQNVLMSVAKSIDGFNKSSPSSTFRGWIYRITARKIIDHFRKLMEMSDRRGLGGSDFAKYLQQFASPEDSASTWTGQPRDVVASNHPVTTPIDFASTGTGQPGDGVASNEAKAPGKSDSSGDGQPPAADCTAISDSFLIANIEVRKALEAFKKTIAPRTWEVFKRTAIEGRTAAEVGAELGMTAHTVRQSKSRTKQRFRELYGDILDL